MVILNHLWTLLSRGETRAGWRRSGRSFDSSAFSDSRHSVLVPNVEAQYSMACAEQVLQTVLKSKFAADVLEFDFLNTYSEPVSFPNQSVVVTTVTGSGVEAFVVDEGVSGPWLAGMFNVDVDPVALTATVISALGGGLYAFGMYDNLSDKIPLADSSHLRLSGTLPGSMFSVSAEQLRPFRRNILGVLEALESGGGKWNRPDLRSLFVNSRDPVDRVSAAALDVCAGYGFAA